VSKQATVTTTIKLHNNKEIEVEAYTSGVPGLVVHRSYEWVPSTGEPVQNKTWQITHSRTGMSLLKGDQTLSTMKAAKHVAGLVEDAADWTDGSPVTLANRQEVMDRINQAIEDVNQSNGSAPAAVFTVQRREDGPGFAIIDSKGKTVDHRIHRGAAWQRAQELSQEA
jgi:hypothetical protein